MAKLIVRGGKPLKGSLTPKGTKNEALQVLCAVLLTDEPVIIHNLPDILDVRRLMNLLSLLGVEIEKMGEGSFRFTAKEINLDALDSDEFKESAIKIRASVMLLGALLARVGKVVIPSPGGDKIGRRKLDTHFLGLEKLGASWSYDSVKNTYAIRGKSLTGSYILLDEASVTGTANLLLAAVTAQGTTTLYNAACEPHVQQLCHMLVAMGANIMGIGSNLLTIQGVAVLKGTTHTVLPDIMEVGSFIGLAALTGSDIKIENVPVRQLGMIPTIFKRLGIQLEIGEDYIHVPPQKSYEVQRNIDGSILTISDSPWPGFSPDLLSIVLVTAVQAKGTVLIHQKMFESRLFFVDKLIDMGAQIILCDPHRANVIGLDRQYALRGIRASSPDVRAGISILIAALSAEGESTIGNIEQIDRGYESIDTRLKAIGADIERIV